MCSCARIAAGKSSFGMWLWTWTDGEVRQSSLVPAVVQRSRNANSSRPPERVYDGRSGRNRASPPGPVLINYTVGNALRETADADDLALMKDRSERDSVLVSVHTRCRKGQYGEHDRGDHSGITHVHHFYTERNLWVLAAFRAISASYRDRQSPDLRCHCFWLHDCRHREYCQA